MGNHYENLGMESDTQLHTSAGKISQSYILVAAALPHVSSRKWSKAKHRGSLCVP